MIGYLLKRPMLLSAVCCSAISIIGFYYPTLILPIMLLLSLIITIMIIKRANAKIIFVAALIFLMCISCRVTSSKINKLSYYGGNTCSAELIVISTDFKCEDYYVSTAQVVKSDTLPKNTKLSVFYEPQQLSEGSRISADIRAKKISGSLSKKDSYSQDIFLKGNISNIKILQGNGDFILSLVGKIKAYIKNQLFSNLEYSKASTLCALIYGDRSYFTNEFYGFVKSAGVSHIMVVSGMHLSIIIMFITGLLEKLYYNRFVKGFVIIIAVLCLTVLCGFTMSILRAGITYLIMAIGIMLDRKGKGENSLGLAITLILLFSPFAIFSISLQLSALSTLAILAVAIPTTDYIKEKGIIKNPILISLVSAVLISLNATIFTLPIVIKIFGYVSTVSTITNLLISFAVTLALCFSVSALVISLLLPPISTIIFYPAGVTAKYINFIINYFGAMPNATARLPKHISILAILLIFLLLCLLLACKRERNMVKLSGMIDKIKKEGGEKVKWQ